MTLRFALLKVLQILPRLWGVDAAEPPARHERGERLARENLANLHTKWGRSFLPPRNHRDHG